ncbi:helix-turn-helix transcriptional regulator [Anatilimnocola floriformis]|uniref:helix-turn-helix transcriptional regulator n=1 Tax=Anatilimnocola floriformis TaxID=2948575 RepID=UPI0020C55222|nr:winged helix-turn-helix transcriptional regulator [Anatilimnocola floriformis]
MIHELYFVILYSAVSELTRTGMKKTRRNALNTASLPAAAPPWTFLTKHTHVLWCIYQEPEIRLRDVAERVGITERMVQKIVAELVLCGYLRIEKNGRRNVYQLQVDQPLRHALESHCTVGQILELLHRSKRRART